MSVKLSGYVFRRIHGRIIPIRKGVQLASDAVNALAKEVLSTPVSKKTLEPAKKFLVGRGVDFNVFGKAHHIVMKVPRNKVGTSSKAFLKAFPETKDKVALSKAVSDNLPNYGIPTAHTEVVRVKGKITGLVQDKLVHNPDYLPHRNDAKWLAREAEKINWDTGLSIDTHSGNIRKGMLIDTGLNLKKSKVRFVKNSQMAQDILGTKDASYYSTKIADVRPETITSSAAEYGTSSKALKQMNKLLKEGKMFARVGDNEYKFAYRKPKLINKK